MPVVEDLQEERGVGAGLGDRLDLGRVQLAGLPAARGCFEDAVDGGEDGRGEERRCFVDKRQGRAVSIHDSMNRESVENPSLEVILNRNLDSLNRFSIQNLILQIRGN